MEVGSIWRYLSKACRVRLIRVRRVIRVVMSIRVIRVIRAMRVVGRGTRKWDVQSSKFRRGWGQMTRNFSLK